LTFVFPFYPILHRILKRICYYRRITTLLCLHFRQVESASQICVKCGWDASCMF